MWIHLQRSVAIDTIGLVVYRAKQISRRLDVLYNKRLQNLGRVFAVSCQANQRVVVVCAARYGLLEYRRIGCEASDPDIYEALKLS